MKITVEIKPNHPIVATAEWKTKIGFHVEMSKVWTTSGQQPADHEEATKLMQGAIADLRAGKV